MSFKDRWLREKVKKKERKGFRGYPIATIAYYGPTDKRASKVVVSIVTAEGAEPELMNKWFCETEDARANVEINDEIAKFIGAHGAKSVVMADRLIGCSHEEGIDYPTGEKCPRCPYWATRDRWLGEVEH